MPVSVFQVVLLVKLKLTTFVSSALCANLLEAIMDINGPY